MLKEENMTADVALRQGKYVMREKPKAKRLTRISRSGANFLNQPMIGKNLNTRQQIESPPGAGIPVRGFIGLCCGGSAARHAIDPRPAPGRLTRSLKLGQAEPSRVNPD